ncbi:MAG: HAD family hydrolase [Desulfobacterales bacterium]
MSSKQKKLKVAAVIFDLDGTLIDSIDIYFTIVENALKRLNLPAVSRNRILEAAESEDFNWELVLPQDVLNRKAEIIDETWAVINEIAPQMFADNLELIQGAERIVESLSSNGLKIGLVTSTRRPYLETKMQPLKNAGVDTLFEAIITSDDTEKKKPAPDPLITCAQQLGIKPGDCVYVGDTTTDIKAGKAAGMRTIAVLTGFDEYQALETEKPDAIIENVQKLLKVIDV